MCWLTCHAACCCMSAQGKSFILNQLLQVTGGFQIGSTTRPCTKGLWMWSSPQRRLDDAGKEYHIVSSRPAGGTHQLHITERQRMANLIRICALSLCTCNSSVAGCHAQLLKHVLDTFDVIIHCLYSACWQLSPLYSAIG